MSMKDEILAQALRLAAKKGYRNVMRQDIATAANTACGTVSYHFKDMAKLRSAVMQAAIDTKDLVVLAQGVADRHHVALKAPIELQRLALRHHANQI
jgi:AcrR family transcriptional regulator